MIDKNSEFLNLLEEGSSFVTDEILKMLKILE
jgi:hypothetical protein